MSSELKDLNSLFIRGEISAQELMEEIVKLRAQAAKQLPLTGAEGLAIRIGEAIGEDVQTYECHANELTVTDADGQTYGVRVWLIEEVPEPS